MKLLDPVSAVLLGKEERDIYAVAPMAPVFEAVLRMSQARVGALLVLDRGKLVGIVSERDYARKIILMGRSSHDTYVREIMTAPVIFVTPSATVDECMQIMSDRKIRHLPVLDRGSIAGIVSAGDLLRWMITAQGVMVEQLKDYITGRYPA